MQHPKLHTIGTYLTPYDWNRCVQILHLSLIIICFVNIFKTPVRQFHFVTLMGWVLEQVPFIVDCVSEGIILFTSDWNLAKSLRAPSKSQKSSFSVEVIIIQLSSTSAFRANYQSQRSSLPRPVSRANCRPLFSKHLLFTQEVSVQHYGPLQADFQGETGSAFSVLSPRRG